MSPATGPGLVPQHDIDGDLLHAVLEQGPASSQGSLNYFNSDGSFSFTANATFSGTATFTYRTVDTAGAKSAPITVNILVDRPVIKFHDWAYSSTTQTYVDNGWVELTSTQTQWVGEKIELRAEFVGPFQPLGGYGTYSWTVDAIKNFLVTDTEGHDVPLSTADRQFWAISFYWMNAGLHGASVDVAIPDYGISSTTVSVSFDILKPSIQPTVTTGSTYFFNNSPYADHPGSWVQMGNIFMEHPSTTSYGIQLTANIGSYDKDQFRFVQLVQDDTYSVEGDGTTHTDFDAWGLDNAYPYDKYYNQSTNVVSTNDSPAVHFNEPMVRFTRDFEAKMYFQWTSKRPGSIFATLTRTNWEFHWDYSRPTTGDTWIPGAGNTETPSATTVQTDELPEWDHVNTNG